MKLRAPAWVGMALHVAAIANAQTISVTLTAPMSGDDTTARVGRAAKIPPGSVIDFAGELMQVCLQKGGTLTFGTQGACPSLAGRGLFGTGVAAHAAGLAGYVRENGYEAQLLALRDSVPRAISDAKYLAAGRSFFEACAAAAAARLTLLVSSSWPEVKTGSCAAALAFYAGGILQIAPGQTATFSGSITAPENQQLFDVAAAEAKVKLTSPLPALYPQWLGAKLDGVTDDTAALQATLDADAVPSSDGSGYQMASPIVFSGPARTTAQLNAYAPPAGPRKRSGYNHLVIRSSKSIPGLDTAPGIYYAGPPNQSALRMIGWAPIIEGLTVADTGQGWVAGISYDGDPAIGISSQGKFVDVTVSCHFKPGDGLIMGANHFQADQATIDSSNLWLCSSGRGLAILDSNTLATMVLKSSIDFNWVGVYVNTSTNLVVSGGEMDGNGVHIVAGFGTNVMVSGVRSESGGRIYSGVGGGAAAQGFTLSNFYQPTVFTNRAATTTTASAGSTVIPLRFATPGFRSGESDNPGGFVFADSVTIAGAGPGGKDLRATIYNMPDSTHAMISPGIVTSVSGAAVLLDDTVPQYSLVESGGGPYLHQNNVFADHDATFRGGTTHGAATPGFNQAFYSNAYMALQADMPTPWGQTAPSALHGNVAFSNGCSLSLPGVVRDCHMSNLAPPVPAAATSWAPNSGTQTAGPGQVNVMTTANTVPTTVMNFGPPAVAGSSLQVYVNDANTTWARSGGAGSILFEGGASTSAAIAGKMYIFVAYQTFWVLTNK